jgi:hypothetical protein
LVSSACVIACIFQQQYVPFWQGLQGRSRACADAVCGKHHRSSERLFKWGNQWLQTELGLALTFWTPEMGQ